MIEVIKDDKEAPVCNAPENFTIYCDSVPYDFILEPFGRITAPSKASKVCDDHHTPICEYETDYLDGGLSPENDWIRIVCPVWLALDTFDTEDGTKRKINFGEAEYYDNCTPNDQLEVNIEDIGSLDECGTGYITRRWTIGDRCGNTSVCEQTIHVLPRSDYEVMFPEDLIVECGIGETNLTPEALGSIPIIYDDECEMIGTTYEDRIFDDAEESVIKSKELGNLLTGVPTTPMPEITRIMMWL